MIKRIFNTNYVRVGYDKNDLKKEYFLEAKIEFDARGNILVEEHYNSDGGVESTTRNEYDEQGRVVASSLFDETGELTQKNTFYYGEDGLLFEKGAIYGEGSPEYITRCIYEGKLLVREDSYDEGEFVCTEKKYEYDADGLLTKLEEFDEDGKIMYRTTNEYNGHKLLKKRHYEQLQENDSRTFVYEYDADNHKTKELLYNYDEKLIAKAYYQYDENGHVSEMEEENLDMYRRTEYAYEGDNCVKIKQFDKETLLAWSEFTYNEKGEVLTVSNYIQDEVCPEEYRLASVVTNEMED